jgi:hypothetical protein
VPVPLVIVMGAVVYPLPGVRMVMPVMTPVASTLAEAVAPAPSPPMVTVASADVSGLFAQFGYGPK